MLMMNVQVYVLVICVAAANVVTGRQRRPAGGYTAAQGNTAAGAAGGGGLGNILDGVQLNLLDAKLIGLGYVREDLVRQLCHQATQQLIWEGVSRSIK